MDRIIIKNAKEHNLKSINLEIPRDKIVVFTGVSGSGKSSLVFDTIYAEGERRYLESLSTYARQFLGQMKKPDVEYIEGLSPAICIEQRNIHANPRSIVGTVTEIYDYLRLLWGSIGKPTCPECGRLLEAATIDEIVDSIMRIPVNTKIMILSPVVIGKKGTHIEILDELIKEGFSRFRIDDEIFDAESIPKLDKNKKHTIEIVVDRIVMQESYRKRISESVETSLKYSNGLVEVFLNDTKEIKIYSEKYYCPEHEISYEEISPRMFSFNSPYGACPECNGLGEKLVFDLDLIIDKDKSINEGALKTHPPTQNIWMSFLEALSRKYNFSLNEPFKNLPENVKNIILYGDNEKINFNYQSQKFNTTITDRYEGVVRNLERRYFESQSQDMRNWLEQFMIWLPCPLCKGKRLRKESLAVKVNGYSIMEITDMTIEDSYKYIKNLWKTLSDHELKIVERVLREIEKRLEFIINVGMDYITLSRKVNTISGGEYQRIKLATQIGSGLTGVLYVLDEPTIGLHSKDTDRLIDTLKKLKESGNTVLIVEHDEEVINSADYIVDIGPGAGVYGGEVVFSGTLNELKKYDKSLTGLYISGKKKIEMPQKRRKGNGEFLILKGAKEHNLKNIDVKFPLGCLILITGVSGSGKSTLINDILYPALNKIINKSNNPVGDYDSILGYENIDKIIDIDQSPIGRTPRSNPATYVNLFGDIRDIFASLPEAKARGYKAGRFSFNVKGGRCEACEGDGYIKVEMHFLPDVYLTCDVCQGKRYNKETLQVYYKDKNIADILDMTVDEAYEFFSNIPVLKRKLKTLQDVGLGYIHLGQSATTLSGGEAQRVKLAKELSKVSTGRTLYILDEPTVGLHYEDVNKLIKVLHTFVDKGNTVIIIEHNLDVIKNADWIIDLGPEGGSKGGEIIFEGRVEEIIKCKKSYTGAYLKKYLEKIGDI